MNYGLGSSGLGRVFEVLGCFYEEGECRCVIGSSSKLWVFSKRLKFYNEGYKVMILLDID